MSWCQTVNRPSGSAAASTIDQPGGTGRQWSAGARASSAYPPPGTRAQTASPTCQVVTPSPQATMRPATSSPRMGEASGGGGYAPCRCSRSGRLTPAAQTAINTSPGPGRGSGPRTRVSCSGPPEALTSTWSMPFLRGNGWDCTRARGPGSPSGQRRLNAFPHLIDTAHALDSMVLRRPRSLLAGIKIHQGAGLFMIHRQPPTHGVLAVVLALYQGLAGLVIDPGAPGGLVVDMIGSPRRGVDPTAADPTDDLFVRHHDFHHVVDGNPGLLQGLGLGNGAGEAVEQEAASAVRHGDALLYQGDDDVVGNQASRTHHALDLAAQLRSGLDRRAQHVAGGDLGDAVVANKVLSLGALARAGRP